MSGIVWEEPSPSGMGRYARKGAWTDVLNQLRERPGKWARIATFDAQGKAAGLASRINTGRAIGALPAGSFEATSRRGTSGREFAVYARYVGETPEVRS